MTTLPRSLKAVAQLEALQAAQVDVFDRPAVLSHDPNVLSDIATRQLLAERLDARAPSSHEDMTRALVEMVGEPTFQAAVDARTQALQQYFLEDDGDAWSRYERPDHRKRLATLVSMVEGACDQCGYAIPRRPTVGTLATRDVNAAAIPGPPDEGHIVAFETGIFNFTTGVAGVAAQAFDVQSGSGGDSVRFLPLPAAGDHIARTPGILFQFMDVLFSQGVLGTCNYLTAYPVPPANAPWARRFKDAMDVFVLAHEYGHVILGHVDVSRVHDRRDEIPARQLELDADRLALDIAAVAGHGAVWAAIGSTLFFAVSDLIDRATATFASGVDAVSESPTHPTGAQRSVALRAVMNDKHAAEAAFANPLSDRIFTLFGQFWAFGRPAFEQGYRDRYPPSDFKPRTEDEKNAALQAFMSAIFPTLPS